MEYFLLAHVCEHFGNLVLSYYQRNDVLPYEKRTDARRDTRTPHEGHQGTTLEARR